MGCTLTRRGFAALLSVCAVPATAVAQARQRFLLLTGAAGGAFNEYGPALATVVARYAPIDLDVQVTGGSNENIRTIVKGDADLGLINMGPAFDAWNGRPPFSDGASYQTLRALFPMYETPFALVALRSSLIQNLSGLEGRTVGVGPAGGTGEIFFKGLSRELGLKAKLVTGSPNDLARRVIAGEVDAFWYGAGFPVAAFVELLDRADALVFGLTEVEVAALRRAFAYFAPFTIPAGSYKGQVQPITTAAVWNFVIGSDRMSDDAAYDLTRAALDHTAEMTDTFATASGTAAANITANTFLPLHPGAARYYREKGIQLSAAIAAP